MWRKDLQYYRPIPEPAFRKMCREGNGTIRAVILYTLFSLLFVWGMCAEF